MVKVDLLEIQRSQSWFWYHLWRLCSTRMIPNINKSPYPWIQLLFWMVSDTISYGDTHIFCAKIITSHGKTLIFHGSNQHFLLMNSSISTFFLLFPPPFSHGPIIAPATCQCWWCSSSAGSWRCWWCSFERLPSGNDWHSELENGHRIQRNSGFSHRKWWIFPVRYVSHYQRLMKVMIQTTRVRC